MSRWGDYRYQVGLDCSCITCRREIRDSRTQAGHKHTPPARVQEHQGEHHQHRHRAIQIPLHRGRISPAAELQAIVTATSTGTAITSGGGAGGALIRVVASKGLNQADTAAQIEEGRDFILWYFGAGSWIFARIARNTGTAIIFEGAPAVPGQPYPVLAIRDDGRIFRGSSARHLMVTPFSVTFIFDWNIRNLAKPDVLKVQVWHGGNWVLAP
jgi:hypothetical protein